MLVREFFFEGFGDVIFCLGGFLSLVKYLELFRGVFCVYRFWFFLRFMKLIFLGVEIRN